MKLFDFILFLILLAMTGSFIAAVMMISRSGEVCAKPAGSLRFFLGRPILPASVIQFAGVSGSEACFAAGLNSTASSGCSESRSGGRLSESILPSSIPGQNPLTSRR
jgi:hypothetical protein